MTGLAVTYDVLHITEYVYESEVSASYGQVHLLPREMPGQVCRTSAVQDRPRAVRLPGTRRLLRQPGRLFLRPPNPHSPEGHLHQSR